MDQPHPQEFETYPDRLIREAIEAGEFDHLPGRGKPLPDAGVVDDELWWVREWLRRNSDASTGTGTNPEPE
jgi:hypothetical protein